MFDNITHIDISDSSINTLGSCQRKFEFRKLYKVPGGNRELATEVGHALHAGYQHFLITKNKDEAVLKMMLRYPIDLNSNPYDYRSLEACYATLQEMMLHNLSYRCEIAMIDCVDGVQRPAVEVPFKINIKPGITLADGRKISISYVGYIDAVLYDLAKQEFVVVDIKTTRFNIDKTLQYSNSRQCLPYGLVIEKALGNPLDGFTVKYLHTYIDIQKPDVSVLQFHKSIKDISEWATDVRFSIDDIGRGISTGHFMKNSNSCINFKKECEYAGICGSRSEDNINAHIAHKFQGVDSDKTLEPWIVLDLELAA